MGTEVASALNLIKLKCYVTADLSCHVIKESAVSFYPPICLKFSDSYSILEITRLSVSKKLADCALDFLVSLTRFSLNQLSPKVEKRVMPLEGFKNISLISLAGKVCSFPFFRHI